MNNMKTLLVFVCCMGVSMAAIQSLDELRKHMTYMLSECAGQEKASDDDLQRMLALQIPVESHEARCALFCFNTKVLVQTDGKFNPSNLHQEINNLNHLIDDATLNGLHALTDQCAPTVADADPCNEAYNIYQCFIESGKKMGIKIPVEI